MSDPMFLTLNEVVERYRGQISEGTLRNWRSMRIGPSFIKIGKAILYPLEELDRWDRRNLVVCRPSRSIQPSVAAQVDIEQVLAFQLAALAASSNATKRTAVEMIDRVIEVAIQSLGEFYGQLTMPLHRPDDDQIASLLQQIAVARASAGLSVLPPVKKH
jgi:hypothetical protein